MNINQFLQSKNISITTGQVSPYNSIPSSEKTDPKNSDFARVLQDLATETKASSDVEFSKHAIERVAERNIDLTSDDILGRLNKAVSLAEEKGSNDALVMIDENAFIVSVKNNKVITTLSASDLRGNIFTKIDSTVIM